MGESPDHVFWEGFSLIRFPVLLYYDDLTKKYVIRYTSGPSYLENELAVPLENALINVLSIHIKHYLHILHCL